MHETELCGIVTRSPIMARLLEDLWLFAPLTEPVLIQGETGTGKSLVARALHTLSARRDEPFVTIECGALPESLIESELFGHERGAFTGADRAYPGRVEAARGGTLFLDEVNSISLGTQGKLLRLLEEGEFCRVGQQRPISIDVRVVAASNAPMADLVAAGRMRADFYYRLNVLAITVPPLRERLEDVPALVRHFLERDSLPRRCGVTAVADTVIKELQVGTWPGNVRELFNVLRREVVLGGEGSVLEHISLPGPPVPPPAAINASAPVGFRVWMRDREREYLVDLMKRLSGTAQVAAVAGLPERTLYRKIKKLELS